MLQLTLNAFHDAVSLLLRGQIEKRNVLEGLDLVLLAADETVDDGYVPSLKAGLTTESSSRRMQRRSRRECPDQRLIRPI